MITFFKIKEGVAVQNVSSSEESDEEYERVDGVETEDSGDDNHQDSESLSELISGLAISEAPLLQCECNALQRGAISIQQKSAHQCVILTARLVKMNERNHL
jgi:hypothetical protein